MKEGNYNFYEEMEKVKRYLGINSLENDIYLNSFKIFVKFYQLVNKIISK